MAVSEIKSRRACPGLNGMALLERKWILRILHALARGKMRFCQIRSAVGDLNSVTLSRRLRLLEKEGVVTRDVIADIPPWVEYELTAKGRDLLDVVRAIEAWSRKWNPAATGAARPGSNCP